MKNVSEDTASNEEGENEMPQLKVCGVSKRFGDVEVLKNIDFTVDAGEIVAVIGSSGSGKTTLLRCLNMLEEISEGKVVFGDDVLQDATQEKKSKKNSSEKVQSCFGLVFQQFNLFPQYSVKANLTLAPALKIRRTVKDREKRKKQLSMIDTKAMEMLSRVGLSDKADVYPSTLSGGQSQRVAIARALMLEPEILFFDEPTSALDPELTGEVLRVIKSLRSPDRAMIIVTHEMNFAKNVADKIIFMSDGVIEEMGTPDEIFNSPKSQKTRSFIDHASDKN